MLNKKPYSFSNPARSHVRGVAQKYCAISLWPIFARFYRLLFSFGQLNLQEQKSDHYYIDAAISEATHHGVDLVDSQPEISGLETGVLVGLQKGSVVNAKIEVIT